MDNCLKCGSEKLKIGVTKITSGSTVYPIYCSVCGYVSTQYVKKNLAQEYERANGSLEYVKTRSVLRAEINKIQIKCEVCKADEYEKHHWAPQHLFPDADSWPTSYLCRACHRKWHQVVTPNMGNKHDFNGK
jgi:protein-arginine kinase activator protein McsA